MAYKLAVNCSVRDNVVHVSDLELSAGELPNENQIKVEGEFRMFDATDFIIYLAVIKLRNELLKVNDYRDVNITIVKSTNPTYPGVCIHIAAPKVPQIVVSSYFEFKRLETFRGNDNLNYLTK